jgi:hypothetical protein
VEKQNQNTNWTFPGTYQKPISSGNVKDNHARDRGGTMMGFFKEARLGEGWEESMLQAYFGGLHEQLERKGDSELNFTVNGTRTATI